MNEMYWINPILMEESSPHLAGPPAPCRFKFRNRHIDNMLRVVPLCVYNLFYGTAIAPEYREIYHKRGVS